MVSCLQLADNVEDDDFRATFDMDFFSQVNVGQETFQELTWNLVKAQCVVVVDRRFDMKQHGSVVSG